MLLQREPAPIRLPRRQRVGGAAGTAGVTVNVLRASPSVKMDFHDSPANHHAAVAKQYPKNWRHRPEPAQNKTTRYQQGRTTANYSQSRSQIERKIMLGTFFLVLLILMLSARFQRGRTARTGAITRAADWAVLVAILLVLLLLGTDLNSDRCKIRSKD